MFFNNLKTVLITGSTGGIGRAIAIIFAINGWQVLCHYNSDHEGKELLEKYFKEEKYVYKFLKCDFSNADELSIFIEKIFHFKIDSLINNAGFSLNTFSYEENNLSEITKLFMVNVFAPMMISPIVFNKMKENNFGRIVNISSIAAKYGSGFCSMPYGCSKLALEGITRTMAREGAQYNILINTIRPGVIDTNFHKKLKKNMDKRRSMIPVKKIGDPKDIAKMVYYIGSEQNNFITNDIITISGGD